MIAAAVHAINDSLTGGSWFNYAPNSGVVFSDSNRVWPEFIFWIGGAIIWAGCSFWIFRDRTPPSEG